MVNSAFLKEFNERGFLHQATDAEALDSAFARAEKSNGLAAYIGFDCTATSLHVGSLIQIMILRLLQKHGHKPIVLLGGGTTKVGDPSGKDESRKLQTAENINENMLGIKNLFNKFIKFGGGQSDAILVDNDQWLSKIGYIDFLRDIGPHFSINKMLSFESVKLRLDREQHLSFLEFNYMLLQAYDFVELFKMHNCRVQIGGSDQWGNIVNGIELQRRLNPGESEDKSLFGLTTPLITTSSGAKMGKSAQGAIWLTDELLSSYDYWQFWRNTEDKDVGRFLRLFTELPLTEIKKLEQLKDAEINQAKIILSNEATKICHGVDAAKIAEETARNVFEQGSAGGAIPIIDVSRVDFDAGIPAYKLMHLSGVVTTGGEAKRLIKGGGAKINDSKIADAMQIISEEFIVDGQIKISAGKKKHALVKIC